MGYAYNYGEQLDPEVAPQERPNSHALPVNQRAATTEPYDIGYDQASRSRGVDAFAYR